MQKQKKYVRKWAAGLCALSLLAGLLSGCAARQTADAGDENLPAIIVGCDDYTPFSYLDANGNMTGIDVELAREAFRRMGYRAECRIISWEEKKALLEAGTIDCVWSSFTMDGREDEYQWAGPYMKSHQVVAVDVNSSIQTLQDLKGKVIAVQSTTKPESIFLERTDSRIPLVREVYSLEDRELLYTSLGKGYVDAIAAHETAIRQYMKDYDADYRILDESILTTGIGVAFAKNDTRGLSEQLSRVFEEMRADGTTRTIIGRYLSDPDKYLEVDCAAD